MAIWRGDKPRKAMQPAQRTDQKSRAWVVTVPPPLHQPTEENQVAEVTPEKSDAPLGTETVAQAAASTKADVGTIVADAQAEGSKVKAFFVKHELAFAIVGALAVVAGLLHFVL